MYFLDTNVLISASRTYYSFDLAPSFWHWLEIQHDKGAIASINHVFKELEAGSDQLAAWSKESVPKEFWRYPTESAFKHVSTLMNWAHGSKNNFFESAIADFADSADLMLIAQAKAENSIVVTHEVSQPNSRKRILIPDAALVTGTQCVQPWEVFKTLGLRM